MSVITTRPPLLEVVCPVCLQNKNVKNVLTRATKGSIVEVYCRHCKYRKVVTV